MRRTAAMIASPRSVAFRVVGLSTALAVLAMIAIATLISTLYHSRALRSFDDLLAAHLFNLVGAIGVGEDGSLSGVPNLGDLEFVRPNSGYYWEVEAITPALAGLLRSPSMTAPVASVPVTQVPFDFSYRRFYDVPGIAGERLRVLETEYVLGTEDQAARFRVMGNLSALDGEIAEFNRRVFFYLTLFGAGMVVINAGAILFGLRPLGRIRAALARVREGRAQRLDGAFPPEIEPLAAETNALIDNNRRIIERYRTQVGNLAHSLKTPLAVIVNEGRATGEARGRLIAEQAAAMQRQIDHALQRARIAAQRDSVVFLTPVAEPLGRMVRVLEKLNRDKHFRVDLPEGSVFAGEREDLEEIVGNLLENAAKWARSRVDIRLERGVANGRGRIALVIEDDGPGIPEGQAAEAVKRGRRLDETKPGSGLGLSIVADLAAEYGGSLSLGRSTLGGLRAVVDLPAASETRSGEPRP
jgi:signal transduction histidine kinase